ncbi:hypothetical protein ACFLSJ_06240 [Verrucomicrobiota bacterium]
MLVMLLTALAALAVVVAVGCCVYTCGKAKGLPRGVSPETAGHTMDLLADICQVAFVHAREVRAENVVIATDVVFADYADLSALPLSKCPTAESPEIQGFSYRIFPDLKELADEELGTLFMAPIVAWPVLALHYPERRFPVFLAHPRDGFRLGAKPLRMRWMKESEIQELLQHPAEQLDPEAWPWVERTALRDRLAP